MSTPPPGAHGRALHTQTYSHSHSHNTPPTPPMYQQSIESQSSSQSTTASFTSSGSSVHWQPGCYSGRHPRSIPSRQRKLVIQRDSDSAPSSPHFSTTTSSNDTLDSISTTSNQIQEIPAPATVSQPPPDSTPLPSTQTNLFQFFHPRSQHHNNHHPSSPHSSTYLSSPSTHKSISNSKRSQSHTSFKAIFPSSNNPNTHNSSSISTKESTQNPTMNGPSTSEPHTYFPPTEISFSAPNSKPQSRHNPYDRKTPIPDQQLPTVLANLQLEPPSSPDDDSTNSMVSSDGSAPYLCTQPPQKPTRRSERIKSRLYAPAQPTTPTQAPSPHEDPEVASLLQSIQEDLNDISQLTQLVT